MMLVLERVAAGDGRVGSVFDGTLAASRGETVVLLGSAGAGKTTLLRTVGGFERATAGRIVLDGEIANDLPPNERPTAYVPREDSLFPHLTLFDNVAYGLRLRRAEDIDDRVDDLLGRVGLAADRDRRPEDVSVESRWRAALARAVAIEPRILLVDEPAGDAATGIAYARALGARIGATVLAATSDRTAALSIADKVAFMRNGRVEQVGSPTDIYLKPRTAYVADYVARANLIECNIEGIGAGVVLIELFGRRLGIPQETETSLGFTHGDRALLVARPETVKLVNDADGFPGVVRRSAFLGATAAYEVDVDGYPLSVLDPEVRSGRLLSTGSPVRVGFIQESLRLLALAA